MSKSENLYAIILASGEDHRLKSLTHAVSGEETPKQFASIAGGGSLLQQTVVRYASLLPPERMVVVVASAHEAVACTQLREWPGIDIIRATRGVRRGPRSPPAVGPRFLAGTRRAPWWSRQPITTCPILRRWWTRCSLRVGRSTRLP